MEDFIQEPNPDLKYLHQRNSYMKQTKINKSIISKWMSEKSQINESRLWVIKISCSSVRPCS